MKEVSCDPEGIALTLESLRHGGIVIFPTDTIYGIPICYYYFFFFLLIRIMVETWIRKRNHIFSFRLIQSQIWSYQSGNSLSMNDME